MTNSNPVTRIRAAALKKARPELAQRAEVIRKLGKRVLDNALAIGAQLSQARTLISYDDWKRWLDAEFGWSDHAAQRFMSVFEMSKNQMLSVAAVKATIAKDRWEWDNAEAGHLYRLEQARELTQLAQNRGSGVGKSMG